MHCKLNTKQPVLHTYSLLRTSHCNDLGVTLWIRAARIYDQKENEKLYRRCGGKLYKLIGQYLPLSFLLPDRQVGPIFSANNLLSQHDTSFTVRDITICNNLILSRMTVPRYLLKCLLRDTQKSARDGFDLRSYTTLAKKFKRTDIKAIGKKMQSLILIFVFLLLEQRRLSKH